MENKEIIEYLPEYIQEYQEIKQIMSTEQTELNDLWDEFEITMDNQFVVDANEQGVERYEKILNITKKPGQTLEERKFVILVKMNEQLPYTMNALKKKLENLCGEDGYSIVLQNGIYKITIKVELTAKNNLDAVKEMLDRVIPCNMICVVELIYNTYEKLEDFTHQALAVYTHNQLRNEVLS